MRTRFVVTVALILGLASGAARADKAMTPQPSPQEVMMAAVAEQLAALSVAAQCSDKKSVWRAWCAAPKFSTGTTPALPKGKILLGLTIELETGKDAGDALTTNVGLVIVAFDKTGTAKLMDITPSNDDEAALIADAVAQVAAFLKGSSKSIKLKPDLVAYIKTRTGEYAVTKANGSWTWQGQNPTMLRKVGATWVAIEYASGANGSGIWASVLTASWK